MKLWHHFVKTYKVLSSFKIWIQEKVWKYQKTVCSFQHYTFSLKQYLFICWKSSIMKGKTPNDHVPDEIKINDVFILNFKV